LSYLIENYFTFEMLKKKVKELFTQKFVTKLSKIWGWDPGSGKKPIPDPGSGSRGGMHSLKV
jgi:hypothetical protein